MSDPTELHIETSLITGEMRGAGEIRGVCEMREVAMRGEVAMSGEDEISGDDEIRGEAETRGEVDVKGEVAELCNEEGGGEEITEVDEAAGESLVTASVVEASSGD